MVTGALIYRDGGTTKVTGRTVRDLEAAADASGARAYRMNLDGGAAERCIKFEGRWVQVSALIADAAEGRAVIR